MKTGKTMNKPVFYVHAKTKEKFPWEEYINHGYDGMRRGAKDLPANGYPYAVECVDMPTSTFRNWDDDTFMEATLHNLVVMHEMEFPDLIHVDKAKGSSKCDHRFVVAASNFVTNEMAAWANRNGRSVLEYPIGLDKVLDIVVLMSIREDCGIGADVIAKTVELMKEGIPYADALEKSLPVAMEDGELDEIVAEVLAEFPDKVAEYRKGKKGIASMFVGHVMRKKKGLDPKAVVKAIDEELSRI